VTSPDLILCLCKWLLTRSCVFPGTRLAVTLRGDEPEEKLEMLKDLDLIMLLQYLPEGDEKSSRVHASRR
jgi:hypothetical protein